MNKLAWLFLVALTLITPIHAEDGAPTAGAAGVSHANTTPEAGNPYAAELRQLQAELRKQHEQILWHRRWMPWDLAGMSVLNIRYYFTYRKYERVKAQYEEHARRNPRPGPFGPVARGEIAGVVLTQASTLRPHGEIRPGIHPVSSSLPILRTIPLSVRDAGRQVIRSQQQLRRIATSVLPVPGQTLPQVDFTREMVLIASMGAKGGGCKIEITGIQRSGRSISVSVRETEPRTDGPVAAIGTFPTHAVVIARRLEEVHWTNSGANAIASIDGDVSHGRLDLVPVSGATVEIIPPRSRIRPTGAMPSLYRQSTGGDGAFRFTGMRSMEYTVRVSCPGFETVERQVRDPRQQLVIRLRRVANPWRDVRPTPAAIDADDVMVTAPSTGSAGNGGDAGPGIQTTLLGVSMY